MTIMKTDFQESMPTRRDILDFLYKHKTDMEKRFGVIRIGIAGSVGRDEER